MNPWRGASSRPGYRPAVRPPGERRDSHPVLPDRDLAAQPGPAAAGRHGRQQLGVRGGDGGVGGRAFQPEAEN